MTTTAPLLVRPAEGQHVWHLGSMMRFIATGDQTEGHFWLADVTAPQGSSAPLHRHTREDETFMVADGELTVRVDDRTLKLGPGDIAYAPRHLPHDWRATSQQARFFVLGTPAGFEGYFFETGIPLPGPSALPPPGLEDEIPARTTLEAALVKYGCEFL
ncbi:Cupin domain protein [Thermomonospora echinospora]|uniref:Cupin domain protein n=1 Tax=Thermomonospora echinospora TaxID=1992 RepID=A0A1H6CQJ7_9ACTN|nr:cupin domain-containing protein [Thermomonospora echinospora]SEG75244.1 Cupin domain protein [Thermomonospora echinospora]